METELKRIEQDKLIEVLGKKKFKFIMTKKSLGKLDNGNIIVGIFSPKNKVVKVYNKCKDKKATYFHELFHLYFYELETNKMRSKMLASIKSRMRQFNIIEDAEEFLAEHFALYIIRKIYNDNYDIRCSSAYNVVEVDLPKRIDNIFEKVTKLIIKVLKEISYANKNK